MKRREFLVSTATVTTTAAVGGCIANEIGRNLSSQMEKTASLSNVERRPPAEPEKLDEDEKPTGLEIDINVVEEKITSSSPVRLSLIYTNTGEETLKLNINPEKPGPLESEMKDPGLILLSDPYDPARTAADCWKPKQDSFPQPKVAHQTPIKSGESAILEYELWADPQQTADCVRPADYQFKPLYGSFTLAITTNESSK